MQPLNEELATFRWINRRIELDTGAGGLMTQGLSGAYLDIIPPGKLPAVRYSTMGRGDVRGATNASARIMVTLRVLIAAVLRTPNPGDLVALTNRLDALFHNSSGETADLLVMSSMREEPYTQTEYQDGEYIRHAGGIYRLDVQAK